MGLDRCGIVCPKLSIKLQKEMPLLAKKPPKSRFVHAFLRPAPGGGAAIGQIVSLPSAVASTCWRNMVSVLSRFKACFDAPWCDSFLL